MRIARIESILLRCPFPDGIRYVYSGGVVENMDVCLIRVTDEDGAYGIGEVTHGQFCYEPILGLVSHFSRVLEGHPAADINRAWDIMYQSSLFWNRQGIGIGVMGGIDIALHDLLGKRLQVPVYQLLGGAARSSVRVYASNGLFGDPDPMIADIRRARAANFTAYKMRVVDPETIVSLVEAARQEVGSSMDLIVDAVQGSCAVPWSLAISQRLAAALEPSRVLWLEEPCRVEDVDGYAFLRQTTSLNIAGAESIPTALAFKPYLEKQAFDVLQFDIATSGFTEGRRIAALAGAYSKPIVIHSWGSAVSAMAGVHFALATPNCAMTEYCFMDHSLNGQLTQKPLHVKDGRIKTPTEPGLGITFDEKLLSAYPYQPGLNTMISTGEKDLRL
jgi:L-alanine-DL-glutamate epimerase-like enolase superfamily enzyme